MGNTCGSVEVDPDRPGIDSWIVKIEREEGVPLGIDLDTNDGYSARLTAVEGRGSFANWNSHASWAEQAKAGDHITAVNGLRGSATMILTYLQKEKSLEIEMHRPSNYAITVTKGPAGLGIETRQAQNASSLMVASIVGTGAIPDWNSAHEEQPVGKYDRILSVNGKTGTWSDLHQMIRDVKEGDNLTLVLSQAPPRITKKLSGVDSPKAAAPVNESRTTVGPEDSAASSKKL
jgi:hypothetical protein